MGGLEGTLERLGVELVLPKRLQPKPLGTIVKRRGRLA